MQSITQQQLEQLRKDFQLATDKLSEFYVEFETPLGKFFARCEGTTPNEFRLYISNIGDLTVNGTLICSVNAGYQNRWDSGPSTAVTYVSRRDYREVTSNMRTKIRETIESRSEVFAHLYTKEEEYLNLWWFREHCRKALDHADAFNLQLELADKARAKVLGSGE